MYVRTCIYTIFIYIYNIMILSHIGTVYDSIYMYTNKERAVYIYIYQIHICRAYKIGHVTAHFISSWTLQSRV